MTKETGQPGDIVADHGIQSALIEANDEAPPPSYSEAVLDDGRVEIDLDSKLCRTLSVLVPRIQQQATADETVPSPAYSEIDQTFIKVNIVIQVVGSRGDVQPFIALGQELWKHGHRVRLATHDCFCDFVRSSGLEFFPIGGDPTELMAYMVKNPGLMPSMKSLRAGDVQAKRKMVADMLVGCWKSCIEPDPETGRPFVAEAIIANPPSFAHIHCAQALGIPVHLMFTMPWSVTKAFSHPLANIINKPKSPQAQETANLVSHIAVEWLTWQGLGDVVNEWRSTLGLEDVPFSEGPLLADTLKIPYTYCWSPALVPKPADWGEHIDVCGFFFREPSPYAPEKDLDEFLQAGPAPVYIGFGSIVVSDPGRLTQIILEAVRALGIRAIISKGWSNLGQGVEPARDVLFLGDCPHEWLFQKVSAVVHHGGAGTTACGLLNGRPTAIVPFFGDQKFWGDMVAAAGAGPRPIPQRKLNSQNLAEAIQVCLTEEAHDAAQRLAGRMKSESGVRRAVASFHANLPLSKMRCDVVPERPAAWVLKKGPNFGLSKAAAGILVQQSRLKWSDLKCCDTKVIDIEVRRWEPVTAMSSTLIVTTAGMASSATDIVVKPIQALKRPPMNLVEGSSSSSSSSSIPSMDTTANDPFGRTAAIDLPPAPSSSSSTTDNSKRFGGAAIEAASGLGGFFHHLTKGMLNDMPLAVAEGMRNAPRLYGGEVYEPGIVKDWQSGVVVAAKNFGHGIVEGIGGVVTIPLKERREYGAVGAARGFGTGLLNLVTKNASGAVGLFAFTSQGLYKSIYTATHGSTRTIVRELRIIESEQEAQRRASELDPDAIFQRFEALMGKGKGKA